MLRLHAYSAGVAKQIRADLALLKVGRKMSADTAVGAGVEFTARHNTAPTLRKMMIDRLLYATVAVALLCVFAFNGIFATNLSWEAWLGCLFAGAVTGAIVIAFFKKTMPR